MPVFLVTYPLHCSSFYWITKIQPSSIHPILQASLLIAFDSTWDPRMFWKVAVFTCNDSGFGGLVVSMLASGNQDCSRLKPSDFFGWESPQHACLQKGSKAVCPMSQICGMSKNPIT
jgi:hypothetical protein